MKGKSVNQGMRDVGAKNGKDDGITKNGKREGRKNMKVIPDYQSSVAKEVAAIVEHITKTYRRC